jgi:cytidylate kinase
MRRQQTGIKNLYWKAAAFVMGPQAVIIVAMKCNVERLIEGLVGAAVMADRKNSNEPVEQKRHTYVVTVSRNYGAQGKAVAQLLADRLGVRCCDREILQGVARRANVDADLAKTLDETVKRIKGNWWHGLINGKSFSREQYFHYLVKVVLSVSRNGGVIVGRGAHLILGAERAFRVRIVGTLPRCAERIAARENLDIADARQRVLEVDRDRSEYIRELYDVDIEDAGFCDLLLNSDRFDVETMVENILFAMQGAGYVIPKAVLKVSCP